MKDNHGLPEPKQIPPTPTVKPAKKRPVYSKREQELSLFFDCYRLICGHQGTNLGVIVEPEVLYVEMMHKAFLCKQEGPEVDSLRRCIWHLRHSPLASIKRETPEWDKLITLSNDPPSENNKVFCKNCTFYRVIDYEYLCTVNAKEEVESYITGKTRTVNLILCKDKNDDGLCSSFKRIEKQ